MSISSPAPDLIKPLPIEFDAMSRQVGHDGKPVLDAQRLRDVAIRPEPVSFQIRAVRADRQQMDRHVMGAMAGHRQIEGFGPRHSSLATSASVLHGCTRLSQMRSSQNNML